MNLAHAAAVVVWALSMIMAYALMMTIRSGARLGDGYLRDPSLIATHRRWRWTVLSAIVLVVAVVDPTYRIFHLPLVGFFWWIHLPLIAVFILSLMGTWALNGLKSRHHHRLGKVTLVFGVGTCLSGSWLAYSLLWLSR